MDCHKANLYDSLTSSHFSCRGVVSCKYKGPNFDRFSNNTGEAQCIQSTCDVLYRARSTVSSEHSI